MTAEEYIKAYTRGCSNELVYGGYHEWLTPENALAAVELARKEMKKDAVEGKMELNHIVVSYAELAKSFPKGKDGDKVKVIIIKE